MTVRWQTAPRRTKLQGRRHKFITARSRTFSNLPDVAVDMLVEIRCSSGITLGDRWSCGLNLTHCVDDPFVPYLIRHGLMAKLMLITRKEMCGCNGRAPIYSTRKCGHKTNKQARTQMSTSLKATNWKMASKFVIHILYVFHRYGQRNLLRGLRMKIISSDFRCSVYFFGEYDPYVPWVCCVDFWYLIFKKHIWFGNM